MREIKFRAWDSEHSVWRYGWLTRLVEGVRRFMAIICDDEDGDLVRYYIHNESSIGQYTGLKDVSGVEIYEGDIIEGDYLYGGRVRAVVHWGEYRNGWSFGGIVSDTRRVVGNIHTPVLLEE